MSLVIVAGDESLERRVRSLLPDPAAHTVDRWEEPSADAGDLPAVMGRGPAAIVLGAEIDQGLALDLATEIDRHHPGVGVVMVAEATGETWPRALAAGVRGLIPGDASDDEFRSHLDRAIEAATRRAPASRSMGGRGHPRVITVVSPKGGSGKTIVGTNVAAALAARHPGDVVLVDLDLQFGDVAHALALVPQHTIADACSVLSDLDATLLKVFLTRHRSGLQVLCAPDEPAEGETIPAAAAARVVRLLTEGFGYVIVDTSAAVGEHTRAILDLSTDVVLVCDMDVAAIHSLRKGLDLLGPREARRHLVLNRADSRVGLNKGEVSVAVGATIDLELPSSPHVPTSLNEGRPLVLANPRSPVARRLAELAGRLDGTSADRPGAVMARDARPSARPNLWKMWLERVSRLRARG